MDDYYRLKLHEFFIDHINEFLIKNKEKLLLGSARNSQVKEKLKRFYQNVCAQEWREDFMLAQRLYFYLRENIETINRSLGQINTTRTHSSSKDYHMRESRPFSESVDDDDDDFELSYEFEAVDPSLFPETQEITFQRANQNKKPKTRLGRSMLADPDEPITSDFRFNDDLKYIPSNARNRMKALTMGINDFKYWRQFIPKSNSVNLYKKEHGKKHVNVPGTWMFDLMYFSNFGKKNIDESKEHAYKQVIYLVGINVNTRYAVGRKVKSKGVEDLIPAFEDLVKHELKNKIKLLIFDGEKAISSKKFEEFCKKYNINVKITYAGIHTQTAPIDRLCRTLRDYFTKMFLSKVGEGYEYNIPQVIEEYKKFPFRNEKVFKEKMNTEALYVRQMFNGVHSSLLAPIPLTYRCFGDPKPGFKEQARKIWGMNEFGDYRYIFNPDLSESDYYEERFEHHWIGDELLDVIFYYNHKPHNGLIRIFKAAEDLFRIKLNLDNVTPAQVQSNPELEKIIIEYCHDYNRNVAVPGPEYNIGDDVYVYDCFSTDRGNLQRSEITTLLGEWVIVSKENEIYGVKNKFNDQLRYVSKYMLKHK